MLSIVIFWYLILLLHYIYLITSRLRIITQNPIQKWIRMYYYYYYYYYYYCYCYYHCCCCCCCCCCCYRFYYWLYFYHHCGKRMKVWKDRNRKKKQEEEETHWGPRAGPRAGPVWWIIDQAEWAAASALLCDNVNNWTCVRIYVKVCFLKMKPYICEVFLEIYVFSSNQWAQSWEPTVQGPQKGQVYSRSFGST